MILEDIPTAECLELVARSSFGRLAVVNAEHQPLVVPVNYTLTPDGIVIRTDPGEKLESGRQRLVALEIDDVNPATHEGWSVLVQGHGFEVTDTLDERSERLQAAEVDTWAPGTKARRLLVETSSVTGRRLRLAGD